MNVNASNRLSVKRHLSGLNFRPAMLKSRVLVISKIAYYFLKLPFTMLSARWPDGLWVVCKKA